MRTILLVVVVTIFSSQYVETKVIHDHELTKPENSLTLIKDVRGVSDIWNSIKNSAINALNSVKKIALATKEKVTSWTGNVKKRAQDIHEKFQEKIENMRQKSKTILEDIFGKGQLVKECFKKENAAIEDLLKQILKSVTLCISDNMLSLSYLEAQWLEPMINDTIFINKIEIKMNKCITEEETEQCFTNIRQDIFNEMENAEDKILTSRMDTRGITDEIFNAVVTCSIEGVINASNVIAAEAIHIIACVAKG